MTLKELLTKRCNELGITREQLAWRLKATLEELERIENGELWLGSEALRRLINATGAPQQEIMHAYATTVETWDRSRPRKMIVLDEDASALRAAAVDHGRKDIPSYFELLEEALDAIREEFGLEPGGEIPKEILDKVVARLPPPRQ